MNTFGPINWREYYSISERHRAAEVRKEQKDAAFSTPIPDCPCGVCPRGDKVCCGKSIDPDTHIFCTKYGRYVREAWPLVVGRLRR